MSIISFNAKATQQLPEIQEEPDAQPYPEFDPVPVNEARVNASQDYHTSQYNIASALSPEDTVRMLEDYLSPRDVRFLKRWSYGRVPRVAAVITAETVVDRKKGERPQTLGNFMILDHFPDEEDRAIVVYLDGKLAARQDGSPTSLYPLTTQYIDRPAALKPQENRLQVRDTRAGAKARNILEIEMTGDGQYVISSPRPKSRRKLSKYETANSALNVRVPKYNPLAQAAHATARALRLNRTGSSSTTGQGKVAA